jgi:hypothetical protein
MNLVVEEGSMRKTMTGDLIWGSAEKGWPGDFRTMSISASVANESAGGTGGLPQ